SRRRHTMFSRDWSSDVCSSDLPGDKKIYLDTSFFDQLERQFGASGDFAQAYVIAHEVGHHIQNLTGILPKFNQMRQSMSEAEARSEERRVGNECSYQRLW